MKALLELLSFATSWLFYPIVKNAVLLNPELMTRVYEPVLHHFDFAASWSWWSVVGDLTLPTLSELSHLQDNFCLDSSPAWILSNVSCEGGHFLFLRPPSDGAEAYYQEGYSPFIGPSSDDPLETSRTEHLVSPSDPDKGATVVAPGPCGLANIAYINKNKTLPSSPSSTGLRITFYQWARRTEVLWPVSLVIAVFLGYYSYPSPGLRHHGAPTGMLTSPSTGNWLLSGAPIEIRYHETEPPHPINSPSVHEIVINTGIDPQAGVLVVPNTPTQLPDGDQVQPGVQLPDGGGGLPDTPLSDEALPSVQLPAEAPPGPQLSDEDLPGLQPQQSDEIAPRTEDTSILAGISSADLSLRTFHATVDRELYGDGPPRDAKTMVDLFETAATGPIQSSPPPTKRIRKAVLVRAPLPRASAMSGPRDASSSRRRSSGPRAAPNPSNNQAGSSVARARNISGPVKVKGPWH